jgi:glycosyltransferase involved in cell wall biosynthesis
MPHHLYLAGRDGTELNRVKEAIIKSGLDKEIRLIQNAKTDFLIHLYKKADFFINASGYEGFGFTPFEALNHDCPVFLYRNPVIAEIFNNHPYVLDNLEAIRWADKIHTEYKSGFKNKSVSDLLKNLTWARCTAEFNKLIQETG